MIFGVSEKRLLVRYLDKNYRVLEIWLKRGVIRSFTVYTHVRVAC
jgi:hypothetical protein